MATATEEFMVLDAWGVDDDPDGTFHVHLHGRTADGRLVVADVAGVMVHFYAQMRQGCGPMRLAQELRMRAGIDVGADASITPTRRRLLNGYRGTPGAPADPETHVFAKVGIRAPGVFGDAVDAVRGQYCQATHETYLGPPGPRRAAAIAQHFLEETGIRPCGWVRAKGQRGEGPLLHVADAEQLEALPERTDLAPIVVASFDGEMRPHNAKAFPIAKNGDPVICLATRVARLVNGEPRDVRDVCHYLAPSGGLVEGLAGSHARPESDTPYEVRAYATEREMLEGWAAFVGAEVDADILTGYNIAMFDLGYMAERAASLRADGFLRALGRLGKTASVAMVKTSSAQRGDREMASLHAPGRVVLDMFTAVQPFKLDSFALRAVATHFLPNEAGKVDLPYERMFELFESRAAGDHLTIAAYCVQDAALPLLLLARLATLAAAATMARQTRTLVNLLLNGGQQVRVWNQLVPFAHEQGFVVDRGRKEAAAPYEGATVLSPKVGFYDEDPVAVCDFASLYPSIMRDLNLCFSTLLDEATAAALPASAVLRVGDAAFAKHVPGVLPTMLAELHALRKATKRRLAAAGEAADAAEARGEPPERVAELRFAATLLDEEQKAIKVSMNSIYGFCGTGAAGRYPCRPIAQTVTHRGREMIELTRAHIERNWPEADVVYGDTDSVMVRLRGYGTDIARAFAVSHEMADAVTTLLRGGRADAVASLEVEKVYESYLLVRKKMYAGRKHVEGGGAPRLDTKGMDKRGLPPLVRETLERVVSAITLDGSPKKAVDLVRAVLAQVAAGTLPFSKFVVSGQLRAEYTTDRKLPKHAQARARCEERRPGSGLPPGARQRYVHVRPTFANRFRSTSENVDDADFAEAHPDECPLDCLYYAELLVKRVCDILAVVYDAPHALFRPALDYIGVRRKKVKQLGAAGSTALPFDAPPPTRRAAAPQAPAAPRKRARSLVDFGAMPSKQARLA
jgi:DNA polymerase elongation subunit (family B)